MKYSYIGRSKGELYICGITVVRASHFEPYRPGLTFSGLQIKTASTRSVGVCSVALRLARLQVRWTARVAVGAGAAEGPKGGDAAGSGDGGGGADGAGFAVTERCVKPAR
eukprot:1196244-Prorocentrum_minimum.AAC.2